MKYTRKVLNLGNNNIFKEVRSEKTDRDKEKEKLRFSAMMKVASELGFSISLPIAFGAWGGYLLDQKFNTAPRLTLSLLVFGIVISISSVIFIMKDCDL